MPQSKPFVFAYRPAPPLTALPSILLPGTELDLVGGPKERWMNLSPLTSVTGAGNPGIGAKDEFLQGVANASVLEAYRQGRISACDLLLCFDDIYQVPMPQHWQQEIYDGVMQEQAGIRSRFLGRFDRHRPLFFYTLEQVSVLFAETGSADSHEAVCTLQERHRQEVTRWAVSGGYSAAVDEGMLSFSDVLAILRSAGVSPPVDILVHLFLPN